MVIRDGTPNHLSIFQSADKALAHGALNLAVSEVLRTARRTCGSLADNGQRSSRRECKSKK